MYLAGRFVLPVSPRLQRPGELYRAWTWAVIGTTAAVPAFVGMKNYRRFAFFRVRDVNIYLADFDAVVTAIADIGIKNHRTTRCNHIRQCSLFLLRHLFLQNPVR